jgi:hypothetical protein
MYGSDIDCFIDTYTAELLLKVELIHEDVKEPLSKSRRKLGDERNTAITELMTRERGKDMLRLIASCPSAPLVCLPREDRF